MVLAGPGDRLTVDIAAGRDWDALRHVREHAAGPAAKIEHGRESLQGHGAVQLAGSLRAAL